MTDNALPQQIGKFIVQDGVVTDTETDLMWSRFAYSKVKAKGVKRVTWIEAMNLPKTLNKKNYEGYENWRVPTINELHYRTLF
jgi:hypothetical protein